jgi:hypothetical protein
MLNRFQRALESFRKHDVQYVVIGGVAAIVHGVPRSTFDLDILIRADEGNARRVLDALLEAGLGTAALTDAKNLLAQEITVFDDYVRIDVQTRTPGLAFETAWKNRLVVSHRDIHANIASLPDLIASKKAAGRPIDLEDVRLLQLSAP